MKLIQVAQRAVDLERAAAFYSRLLGTPPTGKFDPPGLLFFDLDGVRLLLDKGAPTSLIYLGVVDVGSAVEDLRAAGAKIVQEPQLVYSHVDGSLGPAGTDEWMAFIKDSEGNTVGLVGHEAKGA
jgi:methylmalonyl-CoA/ethylmalonyl-CoA epimerase